MELAQYLSQQINKSHACIYKERKRNANKHHYFSNSNRIKFQTSAQRFVA